MGTETIPDRKRRHTIQKSWLNNFRDVLSGNFIGRYLNGEVRADYARLGNQTYKWKRANIYIGHLQLGSVLPFYDYAGVFAVPQGWMLCDGSIINETNYDSQHNTGDWDEYIVSTALSGKYLPNMNAKFIASTGDSLATGAAPIASVGSHTFNASHDHTGSTNTGISASSIFFTPAGTRNIPNLSHTHTVSIPSDLSATLNKEPEYILTKFIMRIST